MTSTMSHPWVRPVCILMCLTLFAVPRLAASDSCVIEPEPGSVEIRALDLMGDDVRVWLSSYGLDNVPITVSLEDQQGVLLDSIVVLGRGQGEAQEVVFSDALSDALDRDLSYRILAEDSGVVALMEPFPFFVRLDCQAPGSPCTYRPIVGFETDALLVSPELAEALTGLPECRLGANLRKLSETHPALLGDIRTLQHQLRRLRGDPPFGDQCTYAWVAEVAPMQATWNYYYFASPSLDEPTIERLGLFSGAAQCVGQQARHLPWSPTGGESFELSGSSEVSLSTLCISGAPPCAPCAGLVGFAAELSSCAAADTATSCDGSHALARADGEMTLHFSNDGGAIDSATADGTEQSGDGKGDGKEGGGPLELRSAVEVASSFSALEPPEAWDLAQQETQTQRIIEAPAEAFFESTVLHENLVDGSLVAQPWCAAPDGSTAFAFAETNLGYELAAMATSSCTLRSTVELQLSTPGDAPLIRDGGLKLKRWRDKPGGG
ncbi:MAG: hypothetical protein AAF560_28835 [Acidobacteriota bacterium]